jgi:magnesium chelatase family protein
VHGQQSAKRALEVACAGGHNIFIGPPGAGKTMLAKRIPTILPPMSLEEAIQTTRIHSWDTTEFCFWMSCRNFQRNVLEVMRQPLEEGSVTIARAAISVSFPSRFMLAAAMNPCPCGYFGDPKRECHCTPPMIQRYVSKISGPLLDRIDIHIEVPAVKYKELRAPASSEDSASVRERVIAARQKQTERFEGEKKTYSNAQMPPKMVRTHCGIGAEGEKLLENAVSRMGLSARAHDRILKVARTIADLDSAVDILPKHLSEAIQYRTLDRSYWA